MIKILIIGKGHIGTAIFDLLTNRDKFSKTKIISSKNIEVNFWDIKPDKRTNKFDFKSAVAEADFIFLCVPSFAVSSVLLKIKPFLNDKTILISVSKGLEKGTGFTMDQIFNRIVPKQNYALISGPMLAKEILNSMGASAVIASSNDNVLNAVVRIFRSTELRTFISYDLRGVAYAGALKNIYSILLGASDGMEVGFNTKGFLFGVAQNEISEIIQLLGGKKETAYLPPIIGDLFATGSSPDSRNHTFGYEIFKSKKHIKKNFPAEGITAVSFIYKKLGNRSTQFPLFMIAYDLIKKPQKGKKELREFIFE